MAMLMAALLLEPLAARLLLRNLMPMLLLSILLTAALLFFAIDHPQGFPWLTALVTRFIAVWTAGSLTSLIPGQQPVPTAYCLVMTLGGVRGAVTLALALSLPVQLEGWWTVQSFAYGVVLFSLFVQAPLSGPLPATLHRRGHL